MIIGKDEALKEIAHLLENKDVDVSRDAFTSTELRIELGYGIEKIDNLIDYLLREGLIEPTRIVIKNRVGILQPTYGYRLTAKAQDKAAAQS